MKFSSKKIRNDFLKFFKDKNHEFIRSSPVLPFDDPTLLFTNDSGFRIRNNSDNTKIGAFSSASITAGQTRTLTFPDADGTIATQAYVNTQITAEDLDIEADSGTIAIDLNSEVLDIEGGTNITTAATGNKVTINMSGSFATEDFATAIAVALG